MNSLNSRRRAPPLLTTTILLLLLASSSGAERRRLELTHERILRVDETRFEVRKIEPLFKGEPSRTFWGRQGTKWAVVTLGLDGEPRGGVFNEGGVEGTVMQFEHQQHQERGRYLIGNVTGGNFSSCGGDDGDGLPQVEISSTPGKPSPFYPGCYPGDQTQHRFSLGLVIDKSFEDLMGGDRRQIMNEIESILAPTRMLFVEQFNVALGVGKIVYKDFGCDTPNNLLATMMSWAVDTQYEHEEVGLWQLLTNCWPPPGTVGIAQLGSLCQLGRNVGISTYIRSTTWLVLTHELGHGFGATHSFEEGMGMTGGIMDYGSPYYNGAVQFHPLKRQQVCMELSNAWLRCPKAIFQPQRTTCGNQILEQGEECECIVAGEEGCEGCMACELQNKQQQCSVSDFIMGDGKLYLSSCCRKGMFARPGATCNEGTDRCVAGQCVRFCTKYGLVGCLQDECSQPCLMGGICQSDLQTTTTKTRISWLPDGTTCTKGRCFDGECVPEEPSDEEGETQEPEGPGEEEEEEDNGELVACPLMNVKICPRLNRLRCEGAWRFRCAFCNGKCRAKTPRRCRDREDFYKKACTKKVVNIT